MFFYQVLSPCFSSTGHIISLRFYYSIFLQISRAITSPAIKFSKQVIIIPFHFMINMKVINFFVFFNGHGWIVADSGNDYYLEFY